MRIRDPFIFFLITGSLCTILVLVLVAGIFCSIVAEEQLPSRYGHETVQQKSGIDEISNGLITKVTQVARTIFQQNSKNRMRKKCEKNGGSTAQDNDSNYKNARGNFVRCVQSFVDITQFEAEMAAARSNDEEHTVVGNYCRKVPTFKNCLENVIDSIEPCLDLEERESVNFLYETTSSLLQLACDDGDLVKNFIAAGGTECLASKYLAVQGCAERIFPFLNPDPVMIPLLGVLPQLTSDMTGCSNIQEYQSCTVEVLEKCKNSVPAAIMNDLFDFIRKDTPCEILLNSQLVESKEEKDPQGLPSIPPTISTMKSKTILVKNREERSPKGRGRAKTRPRHRSQSHSFYRHSRSHAASPINIVDISAITVAMIMSLRSV